MMDDTNFKQFIVFMNKPDEGKTTMMNLIQLLGGGRAYTTSPDFLVDKPSPSFDEASFQNTCERSLGIVFATLQRHYELLGHRRGNSRWRRGLRCMGLGSPSLVEWQDGSCCRRHRWWWRRRQVLL